MKQESKKQKTNTSAMKRVFSIIIAISIVFAINVNATAYNSLNSYSFEDTPKSGPFQVITNPSYTCSGLIQDVLLCAVNRGGSYNIIFYLIGETYAVVENAKNNISFSPNISNSAGSINLDENTGLYTFYYNGFYQSTISNDSIVNVPVYGSSHDACIDALAYFEDGWGNESVSYDISYSLPAGNIAYIEFNNSFDSFTLQCTMPTTSYAIGSSPWPESNQYYGFASSLPSGSFTPPTTIIEWTRNGRTSLAGVTNNAVFEYGPHHPTSGNYLVIYNPAYYGGTNNGPYEFMNNGAINIQASNVVSIKVYQLDSQLTQINPGGNLDIDTSLTGVDYEGEFDEETGDIVWANGEQPIDGGGNLPTSSESGFQSFLSNLVQKIVNVFAPAQQAIQTLANAVSNFGTWMYSLYIWLPAPVLNLLTSAITLAIIIGVIKVFL